MQSDADPDPAALLVPEGHGVADAAPAGQYVSAAHGLGAADLAGQNEPAGHDAQLVDEATPVEDVKRPPGQLRQADDAEAPFVAPYWPVGQLTHTSAPVAAW